MKLNVGIDISGDGKACLCAIDEKAVPVYAACEREDGDLLSVKKAFSVFQKKLELKDEDIASVALVSEDPLLKLALGADTTVSPVVSQKAFARWNFNVSLFPAECGGCIRALGAAAAGREKRENSGGKTAFYGFSFLKDQFEADPFTCGGCGNLCDVTRLKINGNTVGFVNDGCGKWNNSLKPGREA